MCMKSCPENAISRIASKEPGGFEYVVDADKCIGCGICSGICPSGIWAMYNNAEAINMYKVVWFKTYEKKKKTKNYENAQTIDSNSD